MDSNKPSLRLDQREISVIFSLFVFVSLLMFTVGILVGKGLTQAKYDGKVMVPVAQIEAALSEDESEFRKVTSVSTDHPKAKGDSKNHHSEAADEDSEPSLVPESAPNTEIAKHEEHEAPAKPLALVPLKPSKAEQVGTTLKDFGSSKESAALLKNPKIKALLESEGPSPSAKTAVGKGSSKNSKYTVQIGSYPDKSQAEQRVELLKKQGFSDAYFSANQLETTGATWFRVWLGYFPDHLTAQKSGEKLQKTGDIKNYLVRKAD
jgi:cell division protein FtsN